MSAHAYGNAQVTALARALIDANRERSSGPPAAYSRVDYGSLVSVLADWAKAADIERILVRNPATLYGFQ